MQAVTKAKLPLIFGWTYSLRRGRQNILLAYVVGACIGDAFFCLRNKAFPIYLCPIKDTATNILSVTPWYAPFQRMLWRVFPF
jgi:hypothetical protein